MVMTLRWNMAIVILVTVFLWGCQTDPRPDQHTQSAPLEDKPENTLPQDTPPYLGHTLSEARKLAAQQGFTLRVMRMDGEIFFGTTDVVPNRIDIAVEGGIIVTR